MVIASFESSRALLRDHRDGRLRNELSPNPLLLLSITGGSRASDTSPRHWYGGAVGVVVFNGSFNTGLTLRTVDSTDKLNWDVYLWYLIEQLPAGKSKLTTYPIEYTLPYHIPNEICPTLLVPRKFDPSGMLQQRGRLLKEISSTGPIRIC
jgi:hypothetical protein